ncbi:MAG: GatB/YqeY domain-containing protein [Patescibacteria group bacterium]
MSLIQQIDLELKESFKSRKEIKVSALRFLSAQIHNRRIEKRSKGEDVDLSDDEVLDVLGKEVKKRKEAIELFKKSGREDLVRKEEEELVFLEVYLPKQMSRSEIEEKVESILARGGGDFVSTMKTLMAEFKGKIDGKIATEIIKNKLDQ